MKNLSSFGMKLQHLCWCSCIKIVCIIKSWQCFISCLYQFLVLRVNPFWIQLFYFIIFSFVGFLSLKVLKPRTYPFRPTNIDVVFTSVSATTVSSMSTIEMEVFSNAQLLVLTILMFVGGEVFTSMLGLHLVKSKLERQQKIQNKVNSIRIELSSPFPPDVVDQIELGLVTVPDFETQLKFDEELKYKSIRYLGFVVLGYLLVVLVVGSVLVSVYFSLVPSARNVLKSKGLKIVTFSVFTTVSTFSNCGFVPTNENMIIFKKNSGLLLLLIPQVLLGNTLFPSCLRFVIWVSSRLSKRVESVYMLKNTKEIGYLHLLPSLHSSLLLVTVFGFIAVQFILFCSMEWSSEALDGLTYEKIVGALFQTVNTRHTGETIVGLSIISPAILVLFVIMMYLPPYTSFLPVKDDGKSSRNKKRRGWLVDNLIFSQLSYLVIFAILVCITERKKIKEDPLNFNVSNIIIEVISAYGNVGYTTGYSCKRQLKPDGYCKDTWYGFSGRWSNKGKLIIILVMFFGRLKKFNMEGGRAWKLI